MAKLRKRAPASRGPNRDTTAYEPTPQERAISEARQRRRAAKPPRARIKVDQEGTIPRIGPDHPDVRTGVNILAEAIGSDSVDFLDGFLSQLANAGSQGRNPDERGINFMLSVVEGVAPKDQVEAMLAAQMAAVHMATLTFARRLAHVDNIRQQDSAERAFNKLARTFTTQVDALKRYRRGGEQKVTVEHVHVHAGGQAIVGSVEHGVGKTAGRENQDDAKAITDDVKGITHAHQSALWGQDKEREPMPPAMPNGRCRILSCVGANSPQR